MAAHRGPCPRRDSFRIAVTAPPAAAGNYISLEGSFTPPLRTTGPVEAPVVASDPADACDTINNADALAGKIALIDRGTCFFADKVRAAQNAGAVAVIVVNNVPGLPVPMSGTVLTLSEAVSPLPMEHDHTLDELLMVTDWQLAWS